MRPARGLTKATYDIKTNNIYQIAIHRVNVVYYMDDCQYRQKLKNKQK